MKTRVFLAALIIGALLCSGIVVADKPVKEPVQVIKFVHYKDDSFQAKDRTLTASPNTNPSSRKTLKPTATPTPAPTAAAIPEPTETVIPGPTETATPTPMETASPEPTATATASPTATPEPTETVIPEPTGTAMPSPPGPDLYRLNGKKWSQTPVHYYVDPVVAGLDADSVTQQLIASLDAWDSATGSDLVAYAGGTDSPGPNNGRNEVYWDSLTDSRIIAMAVVYVNSTAIIEADIQMNSDRPWGIDTDGEEALYRFTDRFDVRNIATHELGHAFGLGDLYESSAIDLTMYGYSSLGQTKKISLGLGDIRGIQALYGT